MRYIKTFKLLVILFLIIVNIKVKAGTEHFNNRMSPVMGSVSVQDDKLNKMYMPSSIWGFKNKSVIGKVALVIDNGDMTYQTDLSTEVTLSIMGLKYNYQEERFDVFSDTVTLSVSIDNGKVNLEKSVFVIKDVHKIIATVIGISALSNVALDVDIEVERYYDFDGSSPVIIVEELSDSPKATKSIRFHWNIVNGAEDYDLEYTYVNNYKEKEDYQGNIDYRDADEIIVDPYLFKFNSTRINLTENSYEIPNIYGDGYIICRIRANGRAYNEDTKEFYLYNGCWSQVDNLVDTAISSFNQICRIYDIGDNRLNKQVTASFAENGKSKFSASYFDGTMRNRQSIVKLNTTNAVLIGETKYDYIGRGVLNILPTPAKDNENSNTWYNILKYYPTLNQSGGGEYTKDKYDLSITPQSLDSTIGASQYYSSNNLDIDSNENRFIPRANGYPFTRTIFKNDNTGRIKSQGGVGPLFQPGLLEDRTTKTYYAGAFQEELDWFLGSEVGYAQYYTKEMLRDPNNQLSVTYKNLAGKVIITGITGARPENLLEIGEDTSSTRLNIDILNVTSSDKNGTFNYSDNLTGTIVLERQFISETVQNLALKYLLTTPDTLKMTCTDGNNTKHNYCFNCVYNLTIELLDEDGIELLNLDTQKINTITADITSCSNDGVATVEYNWDPALDPKVLLKVGTYTIKKTLSLRQDVKQAYAKEYLQAIEGGCLPTLEELEEEHIAKVDTTLCFETCESCNASVDELEGNPYYTEEDIAELRAECDKLCNYPHNPICKGGLAAMLADMSPNGQYGKVKETVKIEEDGITVPTGSEEINPSKYPLSIFNNHNFLPRINYYSSLVPPLWNKPIHYINNQRHYYDDKKGTEISYIEVEYVKDDDEGYPIYNPAVRAGVTPRDYDNDGILEIEPQFLSHVKDFLEYWKPSWAASLVTYHPEYKHYLMCKKLQVSHDFDDILINFLTTTDWNLQQLENNWDSYNWNFNLEEFAEDPVTYDPLFQMGENWPFSVSLDIVKAKMRDMINEYTSDGNNYISLLQASYMASHCGSFDCGDCSYDNSTELDSAHWMTYKMMYYSLKIKLLDFLRQKEAIKGKYYTECIGAKGPWGIVSGFNNNRYNTNDLSQPCNSVSCTKYKDKQSRFMSFRQASRLYETEKLSDCYDPNDEWTQIMNCPTESFKRIDKLQNYADLYMYDQCGQCPLEKDLELFFSGLLNDSTDANSPQLTSAEGLNLRCELNEYLPDLDIVFLQNGFNQTDPISMSSDYVDSSSVLLLNFDDASDKHCEINLEIDSLNATFGYTFEDINRLCCLHNDDKTIMESGDFTMKATVIVESRDSSLYDKNYPNQTKEITIKGTSSCFNFDGCNFDPICKTNTFGDDFLRFLINIKNNNFFVNNETHDIILSTDYILWQGDSLMYPEEMEDILDSCLGESSGFVAVERNWEMNIDANDNNIEFQIHKDDSSYTFNLVIESVSVNFADITSLIAIYPIDDNTIDYDFKIKALDINNNVVTIYGRVPNEYFSIGKCYKNELSPSKTVSTFGSNSANITCFPVPENAETDYFQKELRRNIQNKIISPKEGNEADCILEKGECHYLDFYCGYDLIISEQLHDIFSKKRLSLVEVIVTADANDDTRLNVKLFFKDDIIYTCYMISNGEVCEYGEAFRANCRHIADNSCNQKEIKELLIKLNDILEKGEGSAFYNDFRDCNFYTYEVRREKDNKGEEVTEDNAYEIWNNNIDTVYRIVSNNWYTTVSGEEFVEFTMYARTKDGEFITLSASTSCFVPNCNCKKEIKMDYCDFEIEGELCREDINEIGFTSDICNKDTVVITKSDYNFSCINYHLEKPNKYMPFDFNAGESGMFNIWSKNITVEPYKKYDISFDFHYAGTDILNNVNIIDTITNLSLFRDNMVHILDENGKVVQSFTPNTMGIDIDFDSGTLDKNKWYTLRTSFNSLENTSTRINITFETIKNDHYCFAIDNIRLKKQGICSCDLKPFPEISDSLTIYTPQEQCKEHLYEKARYSAKVEYEKLKSQFEQDFLARYTEHCMQAHENMNMKIKMPHSQYTLYYYDLAGNLIKTVPPEGVEHVDLDTYQEMIDNDRENHTHNFNTSHRMATVYKYNSLNQLTAQYMPDHEQIEDNSLLRDKYNYSSLFYYDALGRIIASQNAQQYAENDKKYSYTLYDALGRIKQTGVVILPKLITDGSYSSNGLYIDYYAFATAVAESDTKTEITKTYYDRKHFVEDIANPSGNFKQENLRNRVSSTSFDEDGDGNYDYATYYSYDIHGNVKTLLQDIKELAIIGQEYKRIDYDYDLISGNVKQVSYQAGKIDQFYHRYEYDADNRITNVYTSKDGVIWDQDAKYFYYKHGPLARTEIGHNKVQAIDYAYTLQGWLKGINSEALDPQKDQGNDGDLKMSYNSNKYVAQDEYGFSLGYFNGDYSAINSNSQFLGEKSGSDLTKAFNTLSYGLYNGNIAHMVTSFIDRDIESINYGALLSQGTKYAYDRLNRIRQMEAYNNFDKNENTWGSAGDVSYVSSYTYDGNGNLQTLIRKGTGDVIFDDLSYNYKKDVNGFLENNKLLYVNDTKGSPFDDIDDQDDGNYQYDKIGNLISDKSEEIDTIAWSNSGKVKRVIRTEDSEDANIEFNYDASGNRIVKTLMHQGDTIKQYYIRDAQGNIMAIYKLEEKDIDEDSTFRIQEARATALPNKIFTLLEEPMYGSSRIGTYSPDMEIAKAEVWLINNPFIYGFNLNSLPDFDFTYWINFLHLKDGKDKVLTSKISTTPIPEIKTLVRGEKQYELSNHLGNVGVIISDARTFVSDTINGTKIVSFLADVKSQNDYYPFGMLMQGRTYKANMYRFGFNGHEKIDEVNNITGSTIDMGDRWLNTQLGRTFKTDAKAKKYPSVSPYSFALNNPIIFIDPDGNEVVWHWKFKNHKNFKTFIDKLSSTDTYNAVFKRFIMNQDNVFIKPATGSGYWGAAIPKRGANGYDLELKFTANGGWLTVDPTFLAKVVLHEGLHHRYNMAQDEGKEADYPTLKKHMDKERDPSQTRSDGKGGYHGDHEAMFEGNIQTFVQGMKEFDAAYGSEHSDDWYNAMAYRGSVQAFTNGYAGLNASTKTKYENIIRNEQRYEAFLNANATYLQNKTSANRKAMKTAKSNVDWKLWKSTRTKTN